MRVYTTRHGIKIYGAKGMKFDEKVRLPDVEAQAFNTTVRDRLRDLDTHSTGRKLLRAIQNTGKTLSIFQYDETQPPPPAGKNVTHPNPQSITSTVQMMVKPFRGNAPNVQVKVRENPAVYQDWKQKLTNAGLRVKGAQAAGTFSEVLRNIDTKFPSEVAHLLVSKSTGMKVQDVLDVENGYRKLTDDEYYKIAFAFYDCLVPGPGIDCSIRYSLNQFGNPEDTVSLGHELIHAWRKMAGRCIVQAGWEEEAMTTGLWLFSTWEFSENKLRDEFGMQRTKKYGCQPYTTLSSMLMIRVMNHVELGHAAVDFQR